MSREFRYTLPGVFFALPMILGYFRLGVLAAGDDQTATIVAFLSAALLSFAAGYPISLAMGALCSDYLLPNPSSELAGVIRCRYGDRFAGQRAMGMMVSTLHHRHLDEKLLDFLSRRQTSFYMAVNSAVALAAGTLLCCFWRVIRLGVLAEFRWCFELPEVICGILFIFFAACHAATNYQHHHRLIAMVEPFLIEVLATEACPTQLPMLRIDSPQLGATWKWVGMALVILLIGLCFRHSIGQ